MGNASEMSSIFAIRLLLAISEVRLLRLLFELGVAPEDGQVVVAEVETVEVVLVSLRASH